MTTDELDALMKQQEFELVELMSIGGIAKPGSEDTSARVYRRDSIRIAVSSSFIPAMTLAEAKRSIEFELERPDAKLHPWEESE